MRGLDTDSTAPPDPTAAGGEPGGRPIAEDAVLSDCSSAALLHRDGSIDWLCLPRFDSPSVFARILDERAGHWSIHPTAAFTVQRRYLPGQLAVETTFTTDGRVVRLVDAMAAREGQRGH